VYKYSNNSPNINSDINGQQSKPSNDVSGIPDEGMLPITNEQFVSDSIAGVKGSDDSQMLNKDDVDGIAVLEIEPGKNALSFFSSVKRFQYVVEITKIPSEYRPQLLEAIAKGDLEAAKKIAFEAFNTRQNARIKAQEGLTPASKELSERMDERLSFEELLKKKADSISKKNPQETSNLEERVFESTISTSGKSRLSIKLLAGAGAIFNGYQAYKSVKSIYEAPLEEKLSTTAAETGSWIGGTIGGELGLTGGLALAPETGGLSVGVPLVLMIAGGLFGSTGGRFITETFTKENLDKFSHTTGDILKSLVNSVMQGPNPTLWR
jgi:hypothetical protein